MGRIADYIYGKGSEFSKIAFSAIKNGKRTMERLGKAISETVKEKGGFSGFMDRLKKVYSQSVNDAKRTARSESTRVENLGRLNAGKDWKEQSGEQIMKTWICTFHNSRDSHIALHGVTIPIDEDFHAYGGPMQYPGDNSRVGPEEICNCQCYLVISKE